MVKNCTFFVMHQDEVHRLTLELEASREKTKENQEKIKLNKQLPYLVGNVVEVCLLLMDGYQCQKWIHEMDFTTWRAMVVL